jgi:hypothetical protein
MTKYLNANDILTVDDRQIEEVKVAEWGGVVRVTGMSGHDRDEWELSLVNGERQNIRASIAAKCIVDAKGKRLFADKQIEVLGQKSGAALNRVYEVAARLSGITDSDVEELEANFTEGQSDDSGSS